MYDSNKYVQMANALYSSLFSIATALILAFKKVLECQ